MWRALGNIPTLVALRSAAKTPVYIDRPFHDRWWLSAKHVRAFASSTSSDSFDSKANSTLSRLSTSSPAAQSRATRTSQSRDRPNNPPADWDEHPDLSISTFSELPSTNFGFNQHMVINDEFKEALRQILWQFRAPIRYAFAYGSGVFPQTASPRSSSSSQVHPKPSAAISTVQGGQGKMIDFIFGVSYTQHWHSLNLQQHRNHYSAVGSLGSYAVSWIQDKWGAGVYFNPFVTVNGTLIKYGVVNLDTLCKDLSEWDSLYLAGRLQKPVKILRDDARVRLANQVNLLSAVRTALLLLPSTFTEQDLYSTIAGISYLGDPRMSLPTENQNKVNNIVTHQHINFRRLYAPLIENLPNVSFKDSQTSQPDWIHDPSTNALMTQDMDPIKRGNMVRRLPSAFRQKLYFAYQSKFQIPQLEFTNMLEDSSDTDPARVKRRQGGRFEQRIAADEPESLRKEIREVIKKTIRWTSTSQTLKGLITGGWTNTWRYVSEKVAKYREGNRKVKNDDETQKQKEEKKEIPNKVDRDTTA
ncbi:Mitochondrial translocator assembly and maintenance protein 41 [Lambiella insularis]|nr:Mitochondrial translocator assembly and maintenance protein 41 [Lambiella insularis]